MPTKLFLAHLGVAEFPLFTAQRHMNLHLVDNQHLYRTTSTAANATEDHFPQPCHCVCPTYHLEHAAHAAHACACGTFNMPGASHSIPDEIARAHTYARRVTIPCMYAWYSHAQASMYMSGGHRCRTHTILQMRDRMAREVSNPPLLAQPVRRRK